MLLAARSFWFDVSAQREANRKWQRAQAESLRAAEQERLLEIGISVRKEQEASARRRLRQAEQARQNQLALEKDEADRLAEAAARTEIRSELLAERELAKAKLERFQAAEAAAAIAAAIARRRERKNSRRDRSC